MIEAEGEVRLMSDAVLTGFAVVLCGEGFRIAEVGGGVEAVLDGAGGGVDSAGRDDVAGEGGVGGEGVADGGTGEQPGKIAAAPGEGGDALADGGYASGTSAEFKSGEPEGLIFAVVDFGEVDGAAGAEGDAVADAAGALGKERIAGDKGRGCVVVAEGAVELIGAGAGGESDLAHGAEFGVRARDVDAEFLVSFGAVHEGTAGEAAAGAGDGSTVDDGFSLILAAAGETDLEATGSFGDLRGEGEIIPGAPESERKGAEFLASADVGDALGFGFNEGGSALDLYDGVNGSDAKDGVDPAHVAWGEHDVIDAVFLEAAGADADGVGSGVGVGDGVVARFAGGGRVLEVGLRLDGFDGGAGKGGSGRVLDGSRDGDEGALREGNRKSTKIERYPFSHAQHTG